ncbi:MAG: LysR family transcriptional regulator [Coprobacillus sp.]|nr:LysR family transcriptional regulator [Coprobacillus sp.]
MNYEYYKIFYYVGKHRNISKAANELHYTQPSISRTIQNLEKELGCKLFTRKKTGVEFTKEGSNLYEYVSRAFMTLTEGEDEIKQSLGIDGGTIYLGASVTSLYEFLFDFINKFISVYPHVKVKISTGSNNGIIEKLKQGSIDLAFVSTPCNPTSKLQVTQIREFSDVLVAGNKFSELKDKTLSFHDLEKYPIVALRSGMQLRQYVDDIYSRNGMVLDPDVEADGANLIVPMVKYNLGLGFAPERMTRNSIKRGEIFEIDLDYDMPIRQILMISDPSHPQTNVSRTFRRMILDELNKE